MYFGFELKYMRAKDERGGFVGQLGVKYCSLKKSEMRWMRGTDTEDVHLILRNGCNQANAVFLAKFTEIVKKISSHSCCTGFSRVPTKFIHSAGLSKL